MQEFALLFERTLAQAYTKAEVRHYTGLVSRTTTATTMMMMREREHAGAHLQPHLAICFKCHLLDEGSKTNTYTRTHIFTYPHSRENYISRFKGYDGLVLACWYTATVKSWKCTFRTFWDGACVEAFQRTPEYECVCMRMTDGVYISAAVHERG